MLRTDVVRFYMSLLLKQGHENESLKRHAPGASSKAEDRGELE